MELTGPNVAANRQQLPLSRRAASARYFAGDWQALGRLLSREGLGGSYDIILASECIYNESTQRELLECIKQVGSVCAIEALQRQLDLLQVLHCVLKVDAAAQLPTSMSRFSSN